MVLVRTVFPLRHELLEQDWTGLETRDVLLIELHARISTGTVLSLPVCNDCKEVQLDELFAGTTNILTCSQLLIKFTQD